MRWHQIIAEAAAPSGNQALLNYFRDRPVTMTGEMVALWEFYAEDVLEDPEAEYGDPTTSRQFADWLENEGHARQMLYDDPHSAPAWMLMEPVKEALLPRTTWLVHFCDNADRIRREGFRKGVPDVDRIALTRQNDVFGNSVRIRYNEPGYNFAYPADGTVLLTNRWGGYGKQVLLFQSSGLMLYHVGDKERQVVFWGPEAVLKNARVIKATRSGFVADSGEKARTIKDVIAQITGRSPKKPIVESMVRLEGFWITDHGEVLECDHGDDWHHAQIALDHFPQEEDDEEDYDGKFDSGDAAIAEAKAAGWIRGSYAVGKELVIAWGQGTFYGRKEPSRAATESLLNWMVENGSQFPTYRIYVDHVEKVFTDFNDAIKHVKRALRR